MTDAPERLNLRKCLGGGWSSFDDDHGTEYIRADLALPRVKPLVWYPTEDICDEVRAQNYAGIWTVFRGAEDMWVLDTGEFVSEHDTIEAAKDAAQADCERRIMEALE